MADGSVVDCSAEENPDLFYAVPWSYGTLGFLTSATIQMVPVKKFIKMEYKPIYSLQQTVDVIMMLRKLKKTFNLNFSGNAYTC